MRAIYKYSLNRDGGMVFMPTGAVPLHVGEKNGTLYVWCIVYPEAEKQHYQFRVIGTGQTESAMSIPLAR